MKWIGGEVISVFTEGQLSYLCAFFVCFCICISYTSVCFGIFVFLQSEVKWSGGEVISVFTTCSHLSGSEMGREDFSTD